MSAVDDVLRVMQESPRRTFSKLALQLAANRGNRRITEALLTLQSAGLVVAVEGREQKHPAWALTEIGMGKTSKTEVELEPIRAHG